MSAVLNPQGQAAPPPADLFGASVDAANDASRAECALTFTGTLAHHAEVRLKQLDGHGHHVPVVCLDIEDVGAGHHRLHAEQPFTEAERPAAEALAKRLRRGMSVTVTTGLADLRLYLPAATICQPTERGTT
jgi:hypothetical protein